MKITKKIFCLLSMFLLISTTLLTGIANADFKEQSNNLNPIISVSGGLGINIEIEGVNDETSIVITLDGAFIRFINRIDVRDTIKIDVGTLDFGAFLGADDFILHISVGNNIYSYECKSFLFVFTFGFDPIDK